MSLYLERDFNFNFNFNNQNIESESESSVDYNNDDDDDDVEKTQFTGHYGVIRSTTKQNQQFNNLVVNTCKVSSLDGQQNHPLLINSSSKGNQDIIFNKLITINNEGDLTVTRNINLIDITGNVSEMNIKKLHNYQDNLIWGDDVVVTDVTLKAELESINLSQLSFSNEDSDKPQIITIKSSSAENKDYSLTLPSSEPIKDHVLGIINDNGNMGWVANQMPTGTIIMFYGKNIPVGWLECNGQLIDKKEYPRLCNVISENNENDENDKIKLPDLSNHLTGVKMIIYTN